MMRIAVTYENGRQMSFRTSSDESFKLYDVEGGKGCLVRGGWDKRRKPRALAGLLAAKRC